MLSFSDWNWKKEWVKPIKRVRHAAYVVRVEGWAGCVFCEDTFHYDGSVQTIIVSQCSNGHRCMQLAMTYICIAKLPWCGPYLYWRKFPKTEKEAWSPYAWSFFSFAYITEFSFTAWTHSLITTTVGKANIKTCTQTQTCSAMQWNAMHRNS